MRYKSFRIQNFKGIKDATINFDVIAGANVFALVGLNESGKTTILEAIHSFSPDDATSELIGGSEDTGVPIKDRVPRHLISSFTGSVSITATAEMSETEREQVVVSLRGKSIEVDKSSIPSEIVFERRDNFQNGDYVNSEFILQSPVKIRTAKQRKWRAPQSPEEKNLVRAYFYGFTPDIAYFPTFVFDFPSSIFLTERGDIVDRFYRRVFQDVLDHDGRGYAIERDIVRRIRGSGMIVPWLSFLTLWQKHDDRDKIQHVMDRASAVVTQLVFGRWNKIFGEDAKGKEVVISFEITEGEKQDQSGNKSKSQEHDIYIKFQIRDGTRRFDVNDRSLGFRWFFAFMLFTQFRVARSGTRPLLFLFDEPASNLHAAAQQKLIECFPGIAQGKHVLAYSTHSHYMIEPKWLEQTYIVTNRADAPVSSILDGVSLEDESLNIQAATYRSFVNQHPLQTSYFQPILDRLQVVPSRFDLTHASVVIEGRSDYYIIRYAIKLAGGSDLSLIPGLGAGTLGALVGLQVGWNLNLLFVLDGDGEGKVEQDRYVRELGLPQDRVATIDEFVPGIKQIEDLLDVHALDIIQAELKLKTRPSKGQIKRFFQERLASDAVQYLGASFEKHSKRMIKSIEAKLA